MSRRAAIAFLTLGGLAGLVWPNRAALGSLAVRALSQRVPNAAARRGVRVDLGPAWGRWTRVPLAADLGPTLSEVVGYKIEAAAFSRFGGFPLGKSHSAYLDPTSPYYQAWLGAYLVFDVPSRPPFGFDDQGGVRESDVLNVLDADQRLVYRSQSCPRRFPDGRAIRPIGEARSEPITVDGVSWHRVTGEAETWSTYHREPRPERQLRARWLYGVSPDRGADCADFPAIRCASEVWLRHDADLRATCAAFLVAARERPAEREMPASEPLFFAARSLLRQVRFTADRARSGGQ